MSVIYLTTFELSENIDVDFEELIERMGAKVGTRGINGKYLTIQVKLADCWWDEFAKQIANNLDYDIRFALCQCSDTSHYASFGLYEIKGGEFRTIEKISDGDHSEKDDGTNGVPSIEYMKRKYNFEASAIWQVRNGTHLPDFRKE